MRVLRRRTARVLAALRSLPGRRPWHVAIAALAGGLALAPAGRDLALLVALAAAATLALLRAGPVAALAGLLVLAGAVAGQARVHAVEARAGRLADGAPFQGRASLTARPRPSPFGSWAEVEAVGGRLGGAKLLAR